jgi:hypothetical protein
MEQESSIMPIPYYHGRSFFFPMPLTSGPKYVNFPYYLKSAIENHRIVVIRATTFLEDVPQ